MPEDFEELDANEIDWTRMVTQPHRPDTTYVPELNPDDIDPDFLANIPLVIPKRVARRPKPAQRRVTKVPGKQEFYQRPEDIGTTAARGLNMSGFKFDTRPFKAFEAMTPQEKLRLASERGVPGIRSATPSEREQTKQLNQRETAIRRRREGPSLWGLVEPMRELGEAHQTLTYETPNVFLKGLAALPEGAAEVLIQKPLFDKRQGDNRPILPALRKFTDAAGKVIDEAFPVEEQLSPVSQTLGSAAQFIVPGRALQAMGVPARATAGAIGVASNVQQIAREMDRFKDVSPERRDAAIAMAAATGLTEMVGLGATIDKLGLKQAFARRLLDIGEEGGQEVLQQWLNNLNAKVVGAYDKKRPLTKDLMMSFIMGTGGGAMFQGIAMARNRRPGTPPPPAQRWQPQDMQATQMELPFPPDVEEVSVPRPDDQQPTLGQRINNEPTMVDLGTGFGETARKFPRQQSAYGEDLGIAKVGKKGRRPKQKSIMPTEEERLLDIEGGIEIPIASKAEMDAPIEFPLTDKIKADRPITAEVLRNTDPMTGLPLASAEMTPQDSMDVREDNLLEYLRDSTAFDKKGNPIVGYQPAVAPVEPNTVDMYMQRGLQFGGGGMEIYQNPETANHVVNDPWALDFQYQDIIDHPDYQSLYTKILERKKKEYLIGSYYDDIPDYQLGLIEEDARRQTEDTIRGRYTFGAGKFTDEARYARSLSLRPYYMNVINPFEMTAMYGANHISAIREAIRRDLFEGVGMLRKPEEIEARNWKVDDMMVLLEDELLDGIREGITGRELYDAVNLAIDGKIGSDGMPTKMSQVNRILKQAGFDALVYIDEKYTRPKQFDTVEQAQEYADKVGGYVTLDSVMLEPSKSYNDPVTNRFVTVPEKMSTGPTVVGSKVWKVFDNGAIKSATGNQGTFDPNRPEVWASASPQGWERADTSSDTLAFDVMPGLKSGQAPYLRMPQWALNAISGKRNVYGYNLPFESLTKALQAVEQAAPDEAHKEAATRALMDLAVESKIGANVSSLSLISNEGQEDESEGRIRGVIEHELYHAAQREGGMVDPVWAMDHPIIQKVIGPDSFLRKQNPTDDDLTLTIRAAMEIPTYTVQGKLDILGLTSAEGIDYLMDSYTHLLTTRGKAGLDAYKRVSGRMRPEMVEAMDLAESMWTGWQATMEGTSGFLGELAAAEPDIEVNSPVRSKSRGKNGIVTKMGTDEDGRWAEVTFGDGSIEEVYLTDLSIAAPPKAAKVPNKTKAQQELKNAPVISIMGNGDITAKPENAQVQPALPGLGGHDVLFPELPPQVVAAPGIPPNQPPTQMQLPGMEDPQYPPVLVTQVSNVYNQAVDKAFTALLEANGVKFNPLNDVFLQVADAIAEGKIDGQRFQEALAENGLTREQFVERFKNTTSDSARTLAYLSHVKQRWLKAMAKNAALKDVLFTPGELFEMLLKDINNTELGLSLWQRSSIIVRMLMLSDLHIAAVDSIMTAGRIPLAIGVHGGGAWLKTMADGRASGKSLAQNISDATDASLDAMKAGLEVLLVMNPVDIAKAAVGKDSRQGRHEAMVNELFKAFPDLKRKLKDPGIGHDKPAELGNMLQMAEKLVEDIRTKPARQQALTDLKIYQDRFNSNVEGIGNILKGPEVALDWILTPRRWQEWFFRRPMFIGYLDLALRRQHLPSLEDHIRDGTLKDIPPEALEAAIDEALDFTYAYMPKIDGPGFEKAAHHIIKGINSMSGAASLIGTLFPRAIYNGMKFTYEYSPVGALPGLKKMLFPKEQTDPVTRETFRTNPLIQKDYDRFAKATMGTIMFAGALTMLKYGLMGDEWWQVKTGRNTPDGRPIYLDIRRYQPFATFYRLADLTNRVAEGRLGDLQFGKELKESLTGLRNFPGAEEFVSALVDVWSDGDETNVMQKAQSSVGMGMAYLTRPFVNLRHMVAMFSEEEDKRRDLKGTGVLGPLVDNIPWVRRLLPEYQSPTEKNPVIYQDPELLFVGAKYSQGEGYAGREWRRLGLLNRRFVPPDPNPKINRLQNEFFRNMIYDLGQAAESDPSYQQLNDVDRAAYWERMAKKIAPRAAKFGLTADPKEAVKRKVREKANVGELQYKSMGLNKILQDSAIKPDQQEIERLTRQAVQ